MAKKPSSFARLFCAQNGSRTHTLVRAQPPQDCVSTNSTTWAKTKKPALYGLICDLAGARTQDPLLKREMLYQLSYQVISILSLQI